MLSNNPYVKKWIEQFDFEDRGTAKEFLDKLIYVSTETFESEIEGILTELVRNRTSLAIIPVRELIDEAESYFPRDEEDLKTYVDLHAGSLEEKTIDRIKRVIGAGKISKSEIEQVNPVMQNPVEFPGSEAIVANIATRLSRRFRGRVVIGERNRTPSIADLRKNKCRDLILVDDAVGSGHRLYEFVKSIACNRTINSWISGGVITLTVVCYMKSKQSSRYLKKLKQKCKYIDMYEFSTFHDLEEEEVERVETLIEKYSDKREKIPFGYDETFGRVIFGHSIPNNVPPIVWRKMKKWKPNGSGIQHTGSWNALFPNRAMSNEIKHILKRQLTDAKSNRAKLKSMLTLLSGEGGFVSVRQVAKRLEWDVSTTRETIDKLTESSLLTPNYEVTELGLKELDYLRMESNKVEFNTENYYPMRVMGRASAHTT